MEGDKKTVKLYSFVTGFVFSAVLFVAFLVSLNFVLAAWQEPTLAPPDGNVAPPLNTGSINQVKSGGLTIGGVATTTKLCFGITGTDCQTSWSDVLGVWQEDIHGIFYNAGNIGVGTAITGLPTWPLSFAKVAINTGNAEGLYISRNSVVPYSYVNVRDSADNPIFKIHESGKVGIGTDTPNKDLHIYNENANAEIDIQSVPGVNTHWGIYHDGPNGGGTNDLRFWNTGSDRVKFSGGGVVTAADFCTDDGKCLDSSVITTFAGLVTPGTYNGARGGYNGMNSTCNTSFSGSHNCSADEMLVIARNPGDLSGTSGYAWISTGVAGFKDTYLINDCVGWTDGSATAYGSIWNFNLANDKGGSVMLSQCNAPRQVACCF
ncbi:hypothetical protein GW933_02885 [Candidatus Falkowbacteria bacterium]|uniref:DUF1554 domain-containing protein n=1 Tax=Candidatus Buchananbacteria bacterium CG10_big_fil_rev_8_21_14_0_10_33_19 TaxID=1974525 RepID=A0A2H0W4G6_9BACT|nr:hypothetical protein [Candidatus Falkowbacteria bacterium]PIS06255.1 MAG: hypothetical protein COT80_01640 [Candidatus Buchananbacteria bacterium CG10_big_fil_rev_8_21_14_0_10_33_19]